jgi:hypothetical protein
MSQQPPWDPYSQQPRQPPYAPNPQPSSQPPYPPLGPPPPYQAQYAPQNQMLHGQRPYPPNGQQSPNQPRHRRSRKLWPRRHKVLTTLGVVTGFLLILVIASVAASAGHRSASPAAAASTPVSPSAQSSPAARPAAAHTIATFTGSGIKKTPSFTVTVTWELDYSFHCANHGIPGNFIVHEDGGSDPNGLSVNDPSAGHSSSTWAYDDPGTHYLAINSGCTWKVKIVDEP